MGASGLALKGMQWFIRLLQGLAAAVILGIFSYFLATMHNHDIYIPDSVRAVEGISGAAVVYAIVGILLLCCLAGLAITSFIAMILDVAFIGAFIYVAWVNRHGASSCDGYLDTPFGRGRSGDDVQAPDSGFTNLPSFHTACRLQTASLAIAIIGIFFYVLSILMEFVLVRHHRKEKRFGPSPKNNYTSGYGTRGGFFGRFRRSRNARDENTLPEHTHPGQIDPTRASYATETTAVGGERPYSMDHHKYDPAGNGFQQTGVQGARPGTNPNYRYEDGVYNQA